jgi:hypothetical protein
MNHVKVQDADAGYMQMPPKLLRRCMIHTLVLAAMLAQLSPTYARLICAGYAH